MLRARSADVSVAIVMLVSPTMVASARADNTYWQAGTGNWSTTSCWDNGEPSSSDVAIINNGGTAQITQTGEVCNVLFLGRPDFGGGDRGTIAMSSGSLTTPYASVGDEGGTGTFTQTGGTHTVGSLDLGYDSGASGTYELSGTGQLIVTGSVQLSMFHGGGTFIQSGGTNTISGTLSLGSPFCLGAGYYELSGGHLSSSNECIGEYGTGTFTQRGGTNTVGHLKIGARAETESGTYTISGGQLSADSLLVAPQYDSGTFKITGADAEITVSELLSFGPGSTFTAATGSIIHMTSADFEISNTDPTDLGGLSSLELVFEGGDVDVSLFEVACELDGGFIDNFSLGSLTLGGDEVGHVRLVDAYDNTGTGFAEALFVHELSISGGASLDLNGLSLYVQGDLESVLDGWIGDGRLFDSTGLTLDALYDPVNDWTLVPEPATLSLLALGGLAVTRRRR